MDCHEAPDGIWREDGSWLAMGALPPVPPGGEADARFPPSREPWCKWVCDGSRTKHLGPHIPRIETWFSLLAALCAGECAERMVKPLG
jgi:hypothetical protein